MLQPAEEFISTHFPTAAITTIVKEEETRRVSYDVVLNSGTTQDFRECTKINSNKSKKLPDSVTPVRFLEYV